jgi:hypothetical protein
MCPEAEVLDVLHLSGWIHHADMVVVIGHVWELRRSSNLPTQPLL